MIDKVAALPLKNGFRGAVLLSPGTFTFSKTIFVPASGIVPRGSGSGTGGTTLMMAGGRHVAIATSDEEGRRGRRSVADEKASTPG